MSDKVETAEKAKKGRKARRGDFDSWAAWCAHRADANLRRANQFAALAERCSQAASAWKGRGAQPEPVSGKEQRRLNAIAKLEAKLAELKATVAASKKGKK